jgi:hypothetical protein
VRHCALLTALATAWAEAQAVPLEQVIADALDRTDRNSPAALGNTSSAA